MEQEITIGIYVVIGVAVIFGIHGWLHKLVKFKMDESAIVNFLKDSGSDFEFYSTSAISSGTEIPLERVTLVCSNSKAIERNAKHEESWYLK
jgi:hypothetical protein